MVGVDGTPKTGLSVSSYEQMLSAVNEEDSLGNGACGSQPARLAANPWSCGLPRLEPVLRSGEVVPSFPFIGPFILHSPDLYLLNASNAQINNYPVSRDEVVNV